MKGQGFQVAGRSPLLPTLTLWVICGEAFGSLAVNRDKPEYIGRDFPPDSSLWVICGEYRHF